jgi:SAM-dependent methyltransferase
VEDMARKKLIDKVNEKLKNEGAEITPIPKGVITKAEPTDELEKEYQESLKITEADIQARAEAETAAENIDTVPEPEPEELDEINLTESEQGELKTQTENVLPPEGAPDYLEFSAEAVGYENRTHQWAVYHTICGYISAEDSVLDFGCGRGDFERFYQTEYRGDIDYIGIEMNQQLVDASKSAYNDEIDIRCMDWFKLEDDVKQDWSININSNNLRYDANATIDDRKYLEDTIETMIKHSNKGAIIMLASSLTKIDDGLINFNPGDILNWAQEQYGSCAIDHSNGSDVFTLIIYKNEK